MRKAWGRYWEKKDAAKILKGSWAKKRTIGVIDDYVQNGFKVLDAGCGSGFFSRYFLSKGCQVYALDYSEEALRLTQTITERKCECYLKRDLRDEALAEKFTKGFDLIFTDGLLEHFPQGEQRRILNNLIKMKKDEGIIATFLPNRFCAWSFLRLLFMPGIEETPFTLSALIRLHSDLTILCYGGINVFPFKFSPEQCLGRYLGLLLFVVAT